MYIKFILPFALVSNFAVAETIGNPSGDYEPIAPPAPTVDPLMLDPDCHMPAPEDNGPGDQPGACRVEGGEPTQGENFEKTVQGWDSIQDLNNWIGHYFEYDKVRMAQFGSNVPDDKKGQVYTPDQLLDGRTGVCFDLSRFAYESIKHMPMNPKVEYLKYARINFEPKEINGAIIKMHWMVEYKINGKYYFTGDSRCPGRVYGPYDAVDKFQQCYSAFRGRTINSIQLVDTYKKKKSPLQRRGRKLTD